MNQNDQMREALRQIRDHAIRYTTQAPVSVPLICKIAEQALDSPKFELARLTEKEVQPLIDSCYEYCTVKDRRFFEPEKFANAIMDAMIKKNGG